MADTITYAINWDDTGERLFETGVDRGVLYVQDASSTSNPYPKGVAWNGLTGVTESPSGAEANDLYADNIKYVSLRSAETFGATIEAYTYPDEFAVCDGSIAPVDGVRIYQQPRVPFGMAYRTRIGNDTAGDSYGYLLHLIYSATASPSERAYQTVNDSPEAITFSWEITTNPLNVNSVSGAKPTACITINSTTADADNLAALEAILYGTGGTNGVDGRLPLPDEVISVMTGSTSS